jgi:hypothetical protein
MVYKRVPLYERKIVAWLERSSRVKSNQQSSRPIQLCCYNSNACKTVYRWHIVQYWFLMHILSWQAAHSCALNVTATSALPSDYRPRRHMYTECFISLSNCRWSAVDRQHRCYTRGHRRAFLNSNTRFCRLHWAWSSTSITTMMDIVIIYERTCGRPCPWFVCSMRRVQRRNLYAMLVKGGTKQQSLLVYGQIRVEIKVPVRSKESL